MKKLSSTILPFRTVYSPTSSRCVAFLALWRNLSLEANDELIAVHIGTLDLEIMHFVVRFPPFAFSFDRLAPLELRHISGHRLTAHDVVGPELLTSGL